MRDATIKLEELTKFLEVWRDWPDEETSVSVKEVGERLLALLEDGRA